MQQITLDFECYFDQTYNLNKLTTEGYVRDQRFEVLLCAINQDGRTWSLDEPQFRAWARSVDWSATAVVAHHAHFDGLILAHHYNIRPRFWYCTLSMARLVVGNHLGLSLDVLARHFGLPAKIVPYGLFKGRKWSELSADTRDQLARGACHDTELTQQIFRLLAAGFPLEELYLIDATVRMFTEPTLLGDRPLLAQIWEEENAKNCEAVAAAGVDAADLHSTARFTALLEAEGVEVQYKTGPSGAPIPAVAKTDAWLKDLLDHENPQVAALVRARLGLKSTLVQSRAETLGFMASRGPLCVYLRYAGAHTTRWSGGDRANFQNLRRGSPLRRALMAPDGFQLAVIDLSQIECRVLNLLAGETDVIDNFRNGRDPYVGIASQFYGRPIGKNDRLERGTGKQAELSCGYGCGAKKFQATARLGLYGPAVVLADDTAARYVALYRASHAGVVRYWRAAEGVLGRLSHPTQPFEWGLLKVREQRLYLPNGAPLIYDGLHYFIDPVTGKAGYRLPTRAGHAWLYGAKLVENVVQALSRLILSQAMIRIFSAGLRIVGCSHDEIWVLIPNDYAKAAFEFCMVEMTRPPHWLPDLPLDAEGSIGARYEK